MRDRNESHPYILSVIIVGLFGGLGIIFWLGMKTFIPTGHMLITGVLAGAIALGIHFLLMRRLKRHIGELLLMSFAGWGPITVALILLVNYFFHSPKNTIYYRFTDNTVMNLSLTLLPVTVPIHDKRFDNYQHMLEFSEDEIKSTDGTVSEAWFTIARGSLGYEILLGKELH